MNSKRVLTFVTGNPNKLDEVKAIIGGLIPWDLTSKDVDLPELQGEPEDIVRDKCKLAVEKINGPVIVEDTSLCFNALEGLPGPYIKWFLKKLGHEGLNKMLSAYEDKSAFALCTFGYTNGPNQPILTFQGKTNGIIVPARGPNNFGWDPIFQPADFTQTYAELSSSVKNTISHRFKALDKLKEHLLAVSIEQGAESPPPPPPSTDGAPEPKKRKEDNSKQ